MIFASAFLINFCQPASFDQPLSRHLTHLIRAGQTCDLSLIRHGYQLTRCELGLVPLVRSDALSRNLEAQYAECDLSAVAAYEGTIRRLPFNRACALVLSLLQGEPVPAPA